MGHQGLAIFWFDKNVSQLNIKLELVNDAPYFGAKPATGVMIKLEACRRCVDSLLLFSTPHDNLQFD